MVCVLIEICVCALVCRCVGVAYPCDVLGCVRIIIFRLKSTSTTHNMPPRPRVYGSAPRWWCTLKNWLSLPLDAICTERTSSPAIVGNHDTRVVGTTAPASHSLMCVNITSTKDGCGK